MLKSSAQNWGWGVKLFHWLSAALVLYLLADGWWMTHLAARAGRLTQYRSHAVLGYNVLLLFALRLAWRGADRATPGIPVGARLREWRAARGTHALLYVLVIAVSITGWLLAGTFREPLAGSLLGVIPVPMLTRDLSLHRPMEEAHAMLSYVLLAVFVLHFAAALRHRFLLRSDVWDRMTWRGRRS
ncbi:MAG: cytochrome b/b6 domain-containing protein [Betaproteobacteria bacterium]|nr:cytochrome b/b6 domain-containing protein [Betaproteobacteria bacterium]